MRPISLNIAIILSGLGNPFLVGSPAIKPQSNSRVDTIKIRAVCGLQGQKTVAQGV